MKKIFILFICMLALSVHAQRVDVDRIENDGRHQIMTTSRDFYVDDAEYRFTMKIYESAKLYLVLKSWVRGCFWRKLRVKLRVKTKKAP